MPVAPIGKGLKMNKYLKNTGIVAFHCTAGSLNKYLVAQDVVGEHRSGPVLNKYLGTKSLLTPAHILLVGKRKMLVFAFRDEKEASKAWEVLFMETENPLWLRRYGNKIIDENNDSRTYRSRLVKSLKVALLNPKKVMKT